MTTKGQNVDTVEESGGSIVFLCASEKMWISTFDVPLTFMEDLGLSKERTQAAKDFNQKFISGFYARVRSIGEKLSFRRQSSRKVAEEKSEAQKTKSMQATNAGKEAASVKTKPATAGAAAKKKTPARTNAPSNIVN